MPMTAAARGVMQIGLHLLGRDAKLDDVIQLTEQLAGIKFKDTATSSTLLDEPKLTDAIELATVVCNALAVSECVAMGAKFGLRLEEMARILNAGSAWSAISEKILPALANGEAPQLAATLGEANAALTRLTRLTGDAGVPLMLPYAALGSLQRVMNVHGESADLGALTSAFPLR